MNQAIAAAALSASMLISTPVLAREVEVHITNLTNGLHFTPLLVAAHSRYTRLFEVGTAASDNLQAMAEGGDTAGLIQDVEDAGGTYMNDPAGGLLAPGDTTTARLHVYGHRKSHLSIVAMVLPSNDGFAGLDSLRIPRWRGSYTYYVNAYDAGTEANDEIIVEGAGTPDAPGIPADPGGLSGTGATGAAGADANAYVHIHRGVLGDTDLTGGVSDLDSRVHRWLNPVARVVVKVK